MSTGLVMPTHLVIDATAVYVLDRGVDFTTGRILRVAKSISGAA